MKIEEVSFPKSQAYPKSYFEKYYREYPQGFIVAKEKNKILGYAIGKLKDNSGQIISLAVDPLWRKKGIGTLFVGLLIELFKKAGAKEIFLHARTDSKEGISFYRNIGFETTRTIKNYYRNGDDAYLMKKGI